VGWSGREACRTALAVVVLAVACGGRVAAVDPGPGSDGGSTAVDFCPGTLQETNGISCGHAGLMCIQQFTCEGEVQQTVCTCESAHFRCQDPIGLLPPGHDPRCLSNDPSQYYCPASMGLANGLTCNLVGEDCYYDGAMCADGLTKLNYCQCQPSGQGGHVFQCHIVSCEPDLAEGGCGPDDVIEVQDGADRADVIDASLGASD
jgi:hypothetical protein